MDLLEKIDMMIDEKIDLSPKKRKEDFMKILKVINSVKTREQAETARKMILNFFDLHGSNKQLGKNGSLFGIESKNSFWNVLHDTEDLLKGLQDFMKKKYGIIISNKELDIMDEN